MQARELRVVGKGQVDVHALDIRPAMAAAIEDPVVAPIDIGIFLLPQHRLRGRIHPRVHGRRHQPR